jgi:hypothetical protein
VLAEHLDDLGGLVHPHQAVVNQDAGELIADGLVDENGGHRGINPAGQRADHTAEPTCSRIFCTISAR